ncbi:hypothetical protein B7494_g6481 [Chlorociboria aeruginascens]|nr:hypothetical protein B7494_g6481 [Chlorociboria aeruginascens]
MATGTVPAPRKLKILMLHGYTQSGPLFHAKTRALEKALSKAFPASASSPLYSSYPGGVSLYYPTAPMRLSPADIPGYTPSANPDITDAEVEAYAWWRRETGGLKYLGFENGFQTMADAIREAGGIDGVIGFSQGAAAAVFVASLLEPDRPATFARYLATVPDALPFPDSFSRIRESLGEGKGGQGLLKFAVSYSGFYAPNEQYGAFYEPKIKTPVLNIIGSLDSVVDESRSLGLVERCHMVGEDGKGRMVMHPGGHFVPIGKEMVGHLVGFIRECCGEETKREEESTEDMDVPF